MLSTILGTPIPATIAGRVHRLYPLSLNDMAEFERWVQVHVARLNGATFGTAPADAAAGSAGISFYSLTALQAWDTLAGKSYLLWLSIRHGDDKIKPEDLLSGPPSANEEMNAAVRVLNALSFGKPAKDAADPKPVGPATAPPSTDSSPDSVNPSTSSPPK